MRTAQYKICRSLKCCLVFINVCINYFMYWPLKHFGHKGCARKISYEMESSWKAIHVGFFHFNPGQTQTSNVWKFYNFKNIIISFPSTLPFKESLLHILFLSWIDMHNSSSIAKINHVYMHLLLERLNVLLPTYEPLGPRKPLRRWFQKIRSVGGKLAVWVFRARISIETKLKPERTIV